MEGDTPSPSPLTLNNEREKRKRTTDDDDEDSVNNDEKRNQREDHPRIVLKQVRCRVCKGHSMEQMKKMSSNQWDEIFPDERLETLDHMEEASEDTLQIVVGMGKSCWNCRNPFEDPAIWDEYSEEWIRHEDRYGGCSPRPDGYADYEFHRKNLCDPCLKNAQKFGACSFCFKPLKYVKRTGKLRKELSCPSKWNIW